MACQVGIAAMRMAGAVATVRAGCAAAFIGEVDDQEDTEDDGYGDYYREVATGIFCAARSRIETRSGRCQ